MIVEVRTYRIKPERRGEFINFFETRAVPAQRSLGMNVVGPLLDLENPDGFVWLRSFPSLEEQDRMKEAFYEGAGMEGRTGSDRDADARELLGDPVGDDAGICRIELASRIPRRS